MRIIAKSQKGYICDLSKDEVTKYIPEFSNYISDDEIEFNKEYKTCTQISAGLFEALGSDLYKLETLRQKLEYLQNEFKPIIDILEPNETTIIPEYEDDVPF